MSTDPPHPRTHLFTLRLWIEPLAGGEGEIRIQICHVLSGETVYFREWGEVVAFLVEKVKIIAITQRE